MSNTSNSRYSSVAITLHWLMAALILYMIWLGHNMHDHEARFQLHKSVGITLLVLTIARILWRLFNTPPALPDTTKAIEAKLAHAVQFGFYALMVLIPLSGWISVSISEFRVPTVIFETFNWPKLPLERSDSAYKVMAFLHGKGATIGFLGLLLLHIAGAVKHEIKDENGVLKRMIPGLGATDAPPPSKGAKRTLLASLGFFACMVLIPLFSQRASTPELAADTLSPPTFETNYEVIPEASYIRFSGTHDGQPFLGTFNQWNTQIAFHPEALETSEALVIVDLTSATTGEKLYDESLKAAEWFDVQNKAHATVKLSDFALTEAGTYAANAVLSLKKVSVSIPFVFTLENTEAGTIMKGTTTLQRKPLNLGQVSAPGSNWVAEDVLITVELLAKAK